MIFSEERVLPDLAVTKLPSVLTCYDTMLRIIMIFLLISLRPDMCRVYRSVPFCLRAEALLVNLTEESFLNSMRQSST